MTKKKVTEEIRPHVSEGWLSEFKTHYNVLLQLHLRDFARLLKQSQLLTKKDTLSIDLKPHTAALI